MPSAQLAAAKGQNQLMLEFQLFKLREHKQLNCINKFTCYKFMQLETSHIYMSLEFFFFFLKEFTSHMLL